MRTLPALAIFDMDGLIFDSEILFYTELKKTMANYGYALTKEKYVCTLGIAKNDARGMMKDFFGQDYPFDEISSITRDRVNALVAQNGIPIKRGIVELLTFFKQHNVPCCVASSSPSEVVDHYLHTAQLREYFKGLIGGENVSHSKPDPEIFLTSCARYDTAPKDAIVLEDSEPGMLAAITGGIPVIGIPDMKKPRPEIVSQTLLLASDAFEVIAYYQQQTAE